MKNKRKNILILIITIISFIAFPIDTYAADMDCSYSKAEKPECVKNNSCILLCSYTIESKNSGKYNNPGDQLPGRKDTVFIYYTKDNKLKITSTNFTCKINKEYESSDIAVRWLDNTKTNLLENGVCPGGTVYTYGTNNTSENEDFCFEQSKTHKKCIPTNSSAVYIQEKSTKEYDIASHSDELKKFKDLYGNFQQDSNPTTKPQETYDKCEDLIGKDLQEKINEIMNIIKIFIPILLIGFGILDFGKAILVQDDNAMKKAQSTFVKRLIIGIIIFLVPSFINLIINLANAVWPSISAETCIK